MSDIEFVNGLLVKAPHEKAPDFVKANISIKVEELKSWLEEREEEWINIDVKESKGGKWYAAVSTFKPKEGKEEAKKPAQKAQERSAQGAGRVQDMEDDIPFSPMRSDLY